jgi:hypothetical protein
MRMCVLSEIIALQGIAELAACRNNHDHRVHYSSYGNAGAPVFVKIYGTHRGYPDNRIKLAVTLSTSRIGR